MLFCSVSVFAAQFASLVLAPPGSAVFAMMLNAARHHAPVERRDDTLVVERGDRRAD